MTDDKGILIKNVFYMLSYAYRILEQGNYARIKSETFTNIEDLSAAILSIGISQLLKQGLHKDYLDVHESLPVLRGRINMRDSIRHRIQCRQLLACEYDKLSEDNFLNQILKTTAHILLSRSADIKPATRISLKKCLTCFDGVSLIDWKGIKWNRLSYSSSNHNYEMLVNLCRFYLQTLLQTTEQGKNKMTLFSDSCMELLFQRFVFEYFRRHYKRLAKIRAAKILWALDKNCDQSMKSFLPTMETDVMLEMPDTTLIIDTKYYGHIMRERENYGKKLNSTHLYQIFSYVKNLSLSKPGIISGLLLYAKTCEYILPDYTFMVGGNSIGALTLNLNKDFSIISNQLDGIVKKYFG